MRFRLFANAYINMPTIIDDEGHRYEKSQPTQITHPDGRPITVADVLDMDFPATLPANSVSRSWLPLDDEAKALQATLAKPVDQSAAPAPLSADSILAALVKLPAADRAALLAALAPAPAPVNPAKK